MDKSDEVPGLFHQPLSPGLDRAYIAMTDAS
jgi:hypothetical protein